MIKCPYCTQKYATEDEVDDHVLAAHMDAPFSTDPIKKK